MKLTVEKEYGVSIKATLRDTGEFSLALSVSAPYGNRTATATIDTFPEEITEQVKELLQEIIESEAARGIGLAENAAAQSRIAAINMGEEI